MLQIVVAMTTTSLKTELITVGRLITNPEGVQGRAGICRHVKGMWGGVAFAQLPP